uniref:Si:cabz01040626.2 n=1 Tax=Takifugu rubripes TaxID=31033 RepID=A0A674PI78_TAKRU
LKHSLSYIQIHAHTSTYPLPNVALKGKASQSSTLSFSDASKAIDGRRNSFYGSGYCSHTAGDETDPWWRVDLQKKFIITTVKVTNRGDCCHERLDGAEIRIGNEPRNNGNNNSRCALITRIGPGKTSTFHCEQGSMAGRFVNILIPGKRKTLTLCEVEVYGAPEGKSWSLQTQYHTSSASVNGCRNVNSADCCTAELFKHWWKVDLLAVYKIKAITIINVQEDFKETNIYIRNPGFLFDDCPPISCVQASPQQQTQTHTFHCNDRVGRYIQFIFPHVVTNQWVKLCEVEVYRNLVLDVW